MSSYLSIQNKIFTDREDLVRELENTRKNKIVVFTNGCFDILHKGHVSYLSRARDLGDLLVVGLNSDSSVEHLKGSGRPLNSEMNRAFVLAGLECVDYITIFSEETPEKTIEAVHPEIHTKGGDYNLEDLPEKKILDQFGSRIVLLPFEEGFSTTSIIKKASG
ncbi:MAG: D-glycero-beta-D-manno-heptose 1-phosphate adenylyltransferase [Spirochaetia bacterium]|nr:D-glycero-beta-D-manno-heptose 1-phosphate adenylyltransferase [Spirochaetia bacterium]